MGRKIIDLTGQRFGKLIVLELDKEGSKLSSNRNSRWLCKCDCGNLHTASSYNLRRGDTKSCGCLRKEQMRIRCSILGKSANFIDLTGQRFGKLIVIKRSKKRNNSGQTYWDCKCDCGNLHTVPHNSLCTGNTRSCGCLKYENFPKDLTGLVFYRLTVLRRSKRCNKKGYYVYWDCKCECGNLHTVLAGNLRSGTTKSCGCFRRENNGGLALGSNWLNK